MKLPFEYIVERAFQLIDLATMVQFWNRDCILDELDSYLENAGWTDSQFDLELLSRIDLNWEPILN